MPGTPQKMRRNYFAGSDRGTSAAASPASLQGTHISALAQLDHTIHFSMLERCRHLVGARTAYSSFPARGMKCSLSVVGSARTGNASNTATSTAAAVAEPSRQWSSTKAQQQPTHPVAIVGAGPAGLVMSCLLSQFGVPSILLEKAAALPSHPQAHFINLRSMEIMRHAFGGLDGAVLERCPPRDEWR